MYHIIRDIFPTSILSRHIDFAITLVNTYNAYSQQSKNPTTLAPLERLVCPSAAAPLVIKNKAQYAPPLPCPCTLTCHKPIPWCVCSETIRNQLHVLHQQFLYLRPTHDSHQSLWLYPPKTTPHMRKCIQNNNKGLLVVIVLLLVLPILLYYHILCLGTPCGQQWFVHILGIIY